jgi:hypothetical protein
MLWLHTAKLKSKASVSLNLCPYKDPEITWLMTKSSDFRTPINMTLLTMMVMRLDATPESPDHQHVRYQ